MSPRILGITQWRFVSETVIKGANLRETLAAAAAALELEEPFKITFLTIGRPRRLLRLGKDQDGVITQDDIDRAAASLQSILAWYQEMSLSQPNKYQPTVERMEKITRTAERTVLVEVTTGELAGAE